MIIRAMCCSRRTGGTTITVANLNRITVIADEGKPIYTYNAIATTPHMLQLLLSE